MTRTAGRSLVVVVVTTVLQFTVALDLRVDGAAPQLLWLLPVGAGMAGGPVPGAVTGFAAGLASDVLTPTPLGLSALVGTLVGFGVGLAASGGVRQSAAWVAPLAALCGSAAAVMLYAVLGAVLGEEQFLHVHLPAIVAVVALVNALLSWPALRAQRWALAEIVDRAGAPSRR